MLFMRGGDFRLDISPMFIQGEINDMAVNDFIPLENKASQKRHFYLFDGQENQSEFIHPDHTWMY